MKHSLTAAQAQLGKEVKKVDKAEGKLGLLTAGYEKRCATAVEALQRKAAERDEKYVFRVCVPSVGQGSGGPLGFVDCLLSNVPRMGSRAARG